MWSEKWIHYRYISTIFGKAYLTYKRCSRIFYTWGRLFRKGLGQSKGGSDLSITQFTTLRLVCSFILWRYMTSKHSAIPSYMLVIRSYFEVFGNLYALKVSFMPKYVRLEVNERKFNVLRHKTWFDRIHA